MIIFINYKYFVILNIFNYICIVRIESKICKLHKELLPYLIPGVGGPNSNLMNVELYSWDSHTFNLHYVVRSMYNNMSVLYEAILDSTDKFLDWVDLTEFGDNFKIHIHIAEGNKVFSFTYFELMDVTEGNNVHDYYDPYSYRHMSRGVLINHKRYHNYMFWKSEQKIKEQLRLKQDFYKYDYHYPNISLVDIEKPKKKTLVGKIKEKLLNLHKND